MCCGEFIVRYVLFFANLVFTLAGIALIALGVVVIVQIKEILELIPVNINFIPISIIVVGSVVFIIAFCGCCGAIRESGCLLILYAICMLVLAALKTWLAVVIFQNLANILQTVSGWLNGAFNNNSLRGPYQLLEVAFQCCGTTGPNSYISQSLPVSPTCCASPVNGTCSADVSFGGCIDRLGSYFETFGDAIGAVLIIVIIIELVAAIFAFFLNSNITSKRRRNAY